jgi:hypothetical protein
VPDYVAISNHKTAVWTQLFSRCIVHKKN